LFDDFSNLKTFQSKTFQTSFSNLSKLQINSILIQPQTPKIKIFLFKLLKYQAALSSFLISQGELEMMMFLISL